MINSTAEEFKWPPISINIHTQTSINVEHNNQAQEPLICIKSEAEFKIPTSTCIQHYHGMSEIIFKLHKLKVTDTKLI